MRHELEEARQDVVIEAGHPGILIGLTELWQARELVVAFARRDVAIRFKQTALGVLWVLIQPLAGVALFTLVFGRVAGITPPGGIPYPVFALVGLAMWQYFAATLTAASNAMVANAGIIQKVYFPRLALPLAAVLANLLDLVIMMLVCGVVIGLTGAGVLSSRLALVPVLVMALALAALGPGLLLAALHAKYRDVRHALPFVLQSALFLTPVAYPLSSLDAVPLLRDLLWVLNPVAVLITQMRAVLFGLDGLSVDSLLVALGVAGAYGVLGLWYFRRTERDFADVV